MKPVFIYCYDAYCGWCYGFSSIIKRIESEFRSTFDFEVLSGGMILPPKPVHIGTMATYIQSAYQTVEKRSGMKFGQDYLWHIFNPDESDWYPNSEKPAVALCIFKEYYPEQQVQFAADLQYSLHVEGRDLTDNEAYRHLLDQYAISHEDFYQKLASPEYKEKAYYEFALVKQLNVSGFPSAFLQVDEGKFYLVARGFTDYDTVRHSITTASSSLS